jgi:hypothetical protein
VPSAPVGCSIVPGPVAIVDSCGDDAFDGVLNFDHHQDDYAGCRRRHDISLYFIAAGDYHCCCRCVD